jgi:hypothetical protein
VSFVGDATLARYVRTVGGQPVTAADGALVATPHVLVPYCPVSADRSDIDVKANPWMDTKTLGSARVVLPRGGKRVVGTCSRPSSSAPATFTDAAGNPLLLASGGTFAALGRPGAPALFSWSGRRRTRCSR